MNSSPRSQRGLLGAAVVFAIIALGCGTWSGIRAVTTPVTWQHGARIAFESAGLLVLQSPSNRPDDDGLLAAARVAAVMFAFLGTLGVLVELYRPASDALIRTSFWFARVFRKKKPAIVIGLGRVGGTLARAIRDQGRPVYAVTTDDTSAAAAEVRARGALVLVGDARDDRVRRQLPLGTASEVFVATGNDARNNEIAGGLLGDMALRGPVRRQRLECFIHSGDPTFAATLESHRLLYDADGRVGFSIFNLQEETARAVLLNAQDGILRTHMPSGVAHYILIGFGAMGQTLALQMGRLAHFETLQRLRLTIVDHFAGAMTQFLERHPGFCPDPTHFDLLKHAGLAVPDKDGWACREWRPANAAWRSDHAHAVEYAVNAEFIDVPPAPTVPRTLVDALIARMAPTPSAATHVIVIAFDDEQRNFETALGLQAELEMARLEGTLHRRVPMYVYLPTERGLAQLVDASPDFKQSAAVEVRTFGAWTPKQAYEQAAMPDLRRMAEVVHTRYAGKYGGHLAFDDLPPVLQASNIDAAAHLDVKLHAIGFRRRAMTSPSEAQKPLKLSNEQLDLLARMEHNRWLAERLISGWRFGEKRTSAEGHDNHRRLSFVPWEALTGGQRDERWKDIEQVAALDVICSTIKNVVEPIPGQDRRDRTPASTV